MKNKSELTMDEELKYEEIKNYDKAEIEEAIRKNTIKKLITAPISAALYHPCDWAFEQCIRLVNHENPIIRGNAILGFGHLARRFNYAPKKILEPIFKKALIDNNEHVKGHLSDTLDDIEHFCKWKIP